MEPLFTLSVSSVPLGAPTRTWIILDMGAFQLMVVCPRNALPVTGMGFGLAVSEGESDTAGVAEEVLSVPFTPLGKKPPDVALAAPPNAT